MRNVKQIRESYDLITEKEEAEDRKLATLVRAGLYDAKKLPALKKALEKSADKMTGQEKRMLLNLLDSLINQVVGSDQVFRKVKQNVQHVNETKEDYYSKLDPRFKSGYPSDKDVPTVLILKRKAIRVYPDNQKVALYYSQALDKYVTIPFSEIQTGINEEVKKKEEKKKRGVGSIPVETSSAFEQEAKKKEKEEKSKQKEKEKYSARNLSARGHNIGGIIGIKAGMATRAIFAKKKQNATASSEPANAPASSKPAQKSTVPKPAAKAIVKPAKTTAKPKAAIVKPKRTPVKPAKATTKPKAATKTKVVRKTNATKTAPRRTSRVPKQSETLSMPGLSESLKHKLQLMREQSASGTMPSTGGIDLGTVKKRATDGLRLLKKYGPSALRSTPAGRVAGAFVDMIGSTAKDDTKPAGKVATASQLEAPPSVVAARKAEAQKRTATLDALKNATKQQPTTDSWTDNYSNTKAAKDAAERLARAKAETSTRDIKFPGAGTIGRGNIVKDRAEKIARAERSSAANDYPGAGTIGIGNDLAKTKNPPQRNDVAGAVDAARAANAKGSAPAITIPQGVGKDVTGKPETARSAATSDVPAISQQERELARQAAERKAQREKSAAATNQTSSSAIAKAQSGEKATAKTADQTKVGADVRTQAASRSAARTRAAEREAALSDTRSRASGPKTRRPPRVKRRSPLDLAIAGGAAAATGAAVNYDYKLKADTKNAWDLQQKTGPASLRQRDMQANRRALQQTNESMITTLKAMIESNVPEQTLTINEQEININSTAAKKILYVYESVNSTNKKKMEKMLNESADSFNKVLTFAIRQ